MTSRDDLRAMVTSFRVSSALSVAAELALSDLLADGPRTVADLAAAASADSDALHRMLRVLAAAGVYAETEPGSYANTPLSEGLRSDVPGTMRPLARTLQDPALWAAWGHLGHSVRTGENAFEALHGMNVWTHRQAHPEQNAVFNDNMTSLSSLVADAVTDAYDFTGLSTVVDVGGGHGILLEAILARHEHLTGTVFDQEHALPAAPTNEAVGPRWGTSSGDFFVEVPAADTLILKAILHDWPDAECIQILQTCRRALRPGGVVLVVELGLGRPGFEFDVALSDLNMLVLPGGRERSEHEFAVLFEAAGLVLTKVIHTKGRMSIFEAQAA